MKSWMHWVLHFNLKIGNPFTEGKFKNLFCESGKIVGHKCWEVQICRMGELVDIEVVLEWIGSDHAGPRITLGLLGYKISIQIYDSRHWNDNTDSWDME